MLLVQLDRKVQKVTLALLEQDVLAEQPVLLEQPVRKVLKV